MGTKCIVLGENKEERQGTPIEFTRVVNSLDLGILDNSDGARPFDWNFIELIAADYDNGYDLMFAYDNPNDRSEGACFFGHWNDGFVKE